MQTFSASADSDNPVKGLLALIHQRIRTEGPLSVAEYMQLVLHHPVYGYYRTRTVLGAKGDFTTAPEISQMFGELIGAWFVTIWNALGSPDPFLLVELGPGKGTLLSDFFRAVSRLQPDFIKACALHLVESNPLLRQHQAGALAPFCMDLKSGPFWHDTLDTLPTGSPLLLLANEFFDALPVHQLVKGKKGWYERCVTIKPHDRKRFAEEGREGDQSGELTFILADTPSPLFSFLSPEIHNAPMGSIAEIGLLMQTQITQIAYVIGLSRGVALVVDYGTVQPALGDSLQAVRNHQKKSIWEQPGWTDLTTHVDFDAMKRKIQQVRLQTYGPVTQGHFLHQLGIESRASCLARLNPAQEEKILHQYARLTKPESMGALFKVFAFSSCDLSNLPGFADSL